MRSTSVRGDQWERPGRRSDGASFTVETFARYMIHDPVHHLWDVAHGDRVRADDADVNAPGRADLQSHR